MESFEKQLERAKPFKQPVKEAPIQPAPREKTMDEILEDSAAKEELVLAPGQQVFLRNPETRELETGWEYMGTDAEGTALVQREAKDKYGVKTGGMETRELHIDALKTQHIEGLKAKEMSEELAEMMK